MNVFIGWDGDGDGRRTAGLVHADDEEGLRHAGRDVEHGATAIAAWLTDHGGSPIIAVGGAGYARIPADALDDLSTVLAAYEHASDSTVSVGVGTRLSHCDRALAAARLRGGDRVVFYTPEIAQELAEAERDGDPIVGHLDKAEPPPPPEPESTAPPGSPAAGGGFIDRSQAMSGGDAGSAPPPTPGPFDGGQVEQEGESDPGPTSAEAEDEMHQHAQAGAQDDDAAAAARGDLKATKRRVVEVLQQVRQQAPKFEAIKNVDPELYQALQGVVASLILTARALAGQAGQPGPEQQGASVAKSETPFTQTAFRNRETNEVVPSGPVHDPTILGFDAADLDAGGVDWEHEWEPGFLGRGGQFHSRTDASRLVGSKFTDLHSHDPESGLAQKAELPLPENGPTKHILNLPVGASRRGRVKVRHGDGRTTWVSVRAGQVLSADDAHTISARNPGGR